MVLAGDRMISCEDTFGADGPRRRVGQTAVVTGSDGKVIRRIDCGREEPRFSGSTWMPNFALSRDGTRAAHIGADRVVRALDLTTGKELFKLQIGADPLSGVALSPDGGTLFVNERFKDVRRFSLPDGKEQGTLATGANVLQKLWISPDGKMAVTHSRTTPQAQDPRTDQSFVVVHDIASGKALGKIELGYDPGAPQFVGSESVIVSSSPVRPMGEPFHGRLTRYSLKTFQKEWEIRGDGGILRLSPNGKRLAVENGACVRIFDPGTGKRLDTTVAHTNALLRIGFSADGDTVTTRSEWEVMTWTRGGERKTVAEPPELGDGWAKHRRTSDPRVWIGSAADGKTRELIGWDSDKLKVGWRIPLGAELYEQVFSHDGRRAIVFAFDGQKGQWDVTVYDGPAGKAVGRWVLKRDPAVGEKPLALSGDGGTLFTDARGEVVARDPETGKEKQRVKVGSADVPSLIWNPTQFATSTDGTRLAVAQRNEQGPNSSLRVFDVKTGKELAAHDLGRREGMSVAFDRTASRVVVWAMVGDTSVCDAEGTAKPRKLDAGSVRPTCAAFSPNGASLAVGYEDGTALIWDLSAK